MPNRLEEILKDLLYKTPCGEFGDNQIITQAKLSIYKWLEEIANTSFNKDRFEKFLMEEHSKEYQGFDDDMPDAFDKWVCDLDVDKFLLYGDTYRNKLCADFLKRAKEKI